MGNSLYENASEDDLRDNNDLEKKRIVLNNNYNNADKPLNTVLSYGLNMTKTQGTTTKPL